VEVRDSQLPHLMGLQHWHNLPVSQPEKQLEKLFNDEWDIEFLKSADNYAWQTYYSRIESLPYLYNLLYRQQGTVKLVHQGLQSGFRNRKMDMIFNTSNQKLVYVLELRAKPGNNIYIPSSLTVHRPKSRDLQIPHKILNVTNVTVHAL